MGEETQVSAIVLDGKRLAAQLESELAGDAAELSRVLGRLVGLAVVLVGDNPASLSYVRAKERAARRCGIAVWLTHLDHAAPAAQLIDLVAQLNADPAVDGILVQLPLPPQHEVAKVFESIDPLKDVDAFHPHNVGRLTQGRPRYIPCTPQGIRRLLHAYHIPTAGQHVVILGRSEIVGKPLANMLLARGDDGDATVTVCHSRTGGLETIARQADILVAAIGRPRFVQPDMVRPGATVIDVGINRTEHGLVGDVDYEAVREVAGAITPVPGGVGPLTVTMLLANTLTAARLRAGLNSDS